VTTYERVTYRPQGGRSQSVFLRNPVTGGMFLTGIQVDKEGDEIAPKGFDERRLMIELDLIVNREPFVMDKIYGELVPAGTESP
jgi:hypothetical protein